MSEFLLRLNHFKEVLSETEVSTQTEKLNVDLGLLQAQAMLKKAKDDHIYVVGSGGSASLASHFVNDLINACGLSAFTLLDHSILTCMTNDYGYDHAYAKMLEVHCREGDVLFGISSSGQSPTIHNACRVAKKLGAQVITLSGFNANNPLKTLGDLNFWLNADDFGTVELGHGFLLHAISDFLCAQLGRSVMGPLAMRQDHD